MNKWISDTNRTIRALKAVLIGSVVLPTCFVGVMAWQNYDQVFAEAKENAAKTASILREHALKVFESQEMVADDLEDRMSDTMWYRDYSPDQVQKQIERIANHYDHISSIWIVGPDGEVRFGSRDTYGKDYNFADRDYFRELKKGNQERFITGPYVGKVSGKTVFSLADRIGDAKRFNGVTVVSADPDYFRKFYATVVTEHEYKVALYRSDGTLLVQYPQSKVPLAERTPNAALAAWFQAKTGGIIDTVEGTNEHAKRLTAFEKVGNYPVYVTYGTKKAALIDQWRSNVMTYALFTFPLMAGLITAVLLALRSARKELNSAHRVRDEIAKREEAESRVRQMQKIESIGQLTGGIAHDFNNILQGLVFNLELLSASLSDQRAIRSITTMKASVERGVRLTRQLLTFARRQRLKPEVFSLKPRIHEITSMLGNAITEKAILTVDFPDELWPVLCDLHELELAILNIAVNARDAMPDGGRVTITAQNTRFKHDTDNIAAGDYVAIHISDTGCGMAADVMHRMFEPFFTTKETGKGTGLGMSQVWGFVKQSGGHVEVVSEVGQGTMITLYLPRGEAREEEKPLVQASNRIIVNTPKGVVKHVLLVEDEVIIGQMASEMIAELGFSVTLVDRAQKALDVLSSGTKVDLLFTDVMMPGGMDGLELAKQVRQFHPDIPILIATGYAQASLDAVNRNFDIIAKPYNPKAVQNRIQAILAPIVGPQLLTHVR